MNQVERTPVVPLEAGAGPENPPCPACGEPLFGWIGEKEGLDGPVRRCESCGLGVIGFPGEPEEALSELDRLREDDALRIVDRGSFACALGGPDGTTLFLLTSGSMDHVRNRAERPGAIHTVEVEVPEAS